MLATVQHMMKLPLRTLAGQTHLTLFMLANVFDLSP